MCKKLSKWLNFLTPIFLTSLFLTSCSTENNTASTRRWHSFQAKYNTYYNGTLAYIDGSLEKENSNVDNFTEIIPLYTVGNKNSKEIGKGNFDKAIEKSQKTIKRHSIKKRPEWTKNRQKTERDIEWLNRKEYNPFLWKAWMLMGRSQFMKGSFDEAASTFSYISRLYSTQPAIYGKARAWLAKCYIEQDWVYDAEDVITKMGRDSIHWQARKEWDNTMADYYIHTGKYKEAVPYLRKMISHEMRRKQKAREWYLMGQIQAAIGNKEEAYKAYKHVVRLNPPYLLEFNARIAMTEVMAGGKPKQMISKLKRMAASDKNKDYLDQVYYALGNIYLMQKDTANAISAYEKGNEKATRSGIEKGVLLLRLGDLYWTMEKFSDARRCYGEAIGLLDKEREGYEQLSERSKVLDELVPFTEAVELQDSLQELAKMPEEERNAAIDRVIEELKKKEKEEQRKKEEAEAEAIVAKNSGMGNNNLPNKQPVNNNQQQQQNGPWYFYNTMAVNQGKAAFQKQWGKRENVDDWQRANKTVVAGFNQEQSDIAEEMTDSLMQTDDIVQDSLTNETDSAQFDPHKREYYLAQIPFTEEQVAASNLIIMDGLYNSGVIFKDKLDNLPLSEKQLIRLYTQYPDFEQMDNALYHLFLLYSRKGEHSIAATYLDKLKESYPESPWTVLLSDPYYEENARFGVQKEDSLYAATYNAFKAGRYVEVKNNAALSEQRFPLGENRDKFIFINGLGKLNEGDSKGCLEDMQTVVEKYPQSEVSPMAGMIINGVKEGRSLQGGQFDIGDIWARRSIVLNDSDSVAARKFLVERDVNFVCMLAFEAGSVDENRLLFEVARYNFTNFLARNFEISFEEISGLHRMLIQGFRSYDEALQYMRRMYQNSGIAEIAHKARTIIISEKNMELLGTMYSYNDYDKFYEEHFMPLKISTVQLLTEPMILDYDKAQEKGIETNDSNDDGYSDDLYNGGVIDDDMLMDIGIEEDFGVAEEDVISVPTDDAISVPADDGFNVPADDGFNIPADDSISVPADDGFNIPADDGISVPADDGFNIPAEDEINVPAETETAPEEKKKPMGGSAEIRAKMEEKQKKLSDRAAKQQNNKTQQSNQQPATTQQPEIENEFVIESEAGNNASDDTIIVDFGDDTGTPSTSNKKNNKSQEVNIEDEYYELEGF